MRGLDGLHIVSADIVEVAPAYDTNAELTTMVSSQLFILSNTKPAELKFVVGCSRCKSTVDLALRMAFDGVPGPLRSLERYGQDPLR